MRPTAHTPPTRVPGQGMPIDPEGPAPETETPPMRQPDPSRAAPAPPPLDPGPTSAYPHGSRAAATGAIGAGSGGAGAAIGDGSPHDEPPDATSGTVGSPGDVIKAVLHGGHPAAVTASPDARAPVVDTPADGIVRGDAAEDDEDADNPGSVRRRADTTDSDSALGQAGTHPLGTAIGAVGGAVMGAVTGIAAGPLGSLAGAIGGAVAGGILGSGTMSPPVVGPTEPPVDDDDRPAELTEDDPRSDRRTRAAGTGSDEPVDPAALPARRRPGRTSDRRAAADPADGRGAFGGSTVPDPALRPDTVGGSTTTAPGGLSSPGGTTQPDPLARPDTLGGSTVAGGPASTGGALPPLPGGSTTPS